MWLARNEALHQTEDSVCNAKRHDELNEEIDTIYDRKPNDRLLPHADVAFFRNKQELTKKYKLKKKENWVKDATMVIETYEGLINRRGLITDFMYIRRRRDG